MTLEFTNLRAQFTTNLQAMLFLLNDDHKGRSVADDHVDRLIQYYRDLLANLHAQYMNIAELFTLSYSTHPTYF
jgi:hypothetical protein